MDFSFHPPVIAHRGARADAPENTLAAFLKAKELGFQWVEFDVRLASCNEVVVFHDEDLNRTTGAPGLVRDFPYRYLKTLDAGSWFSKDFSDERIPTFAEVLSFLNLQGLSANVEIKLDIGLEEKIVQRVLAAIAEQNMQVPILISSFSEKILRLIRKHSPDALIGFLLDDWQNDWRVICDELKALTVNVNHAILNKERIEAIKSTQRFLLSYTVNDPTVLKKLISWGVDAVFSDYPLFLKSTSI